MTIPKDVYEALTKVLQACREDPTKLTNIPVQYCGQKDQRAWTVENLETIAANHLFDDNPGSCYRITELEGHSIRHYFSVGAVTYDFILDLHTAFPDFFNQPESLEYLDSANSRRKQHGLAPISL